jgi:hypothetical protein
MGRSSIASSKLVAIDVAGLKVKTATCGRQLDDLDRLSLEVAISILRSETDSPGSQKPVLRKNPVQRFFSAM